MFKRWLGYLYMLLTTPSWLMEKGRKNEKQNSQTDENEDT